MYVKKLLQKVDAYLRNSSLQEDKRLVEWDDALFDDSKDPWRTRAYWAVRRFFISHIIFHPTKMYDQVKWFIQRGRRGWSDRDVWSLDWYLCESTMMPDALRHLKKTKHGVPFQMFEGLATNGQGFHDKPEWEIAVARWDAVMDRMIGGWDAARRMQDGLYEDELGDYPLDRPKGVSKEDWDKVKGDHYKATLLLQDRDQKLFEEGMKLFVEHFFSLWD